MLDEINKSELQNFREKMVKVCKIDESQAIVLLEIESCYLSKNSLTANFWGGNFFTGKRLTKINFDNTFFDSINEEVELLPVQTEEKCTGETTPWTRKK